jgi:RNA polymerase sigma-70 factor (ECF subfamily)
VGTSQVAPWTMADPRLDFADLVRAHQSMVYSLALHFLHDPPAAEELAQEVFLQLYRNIRGLETEAHVAHWLRRVTCHRAIDRLRKRKVRPEISLESTREPAVNCPPGDPMLLEAIRKLVASLPEELRAVVVLRYQEDLDPAEIAEALGMPVRKVKGQLHKGLVLLRDKARRYLGEVEQ